MLTLDEYLLSSHFYGKNKRWVVYICIVSVGGLVVVSCMKLLADEAGSGSRKYHFSFW